MRRREEAHDHRQSRSGPCEHVACGEAELYDTDEHATLHALDKCVLEKFENHCYSLALYFVWYNWMRKHKAHGMTPAVAAGLTQNVMTMADVVDLIDTRDMRAQLAARTAMLNKISSN